MTGSPMPTITDATLQTLIGAAKPGGTVTLPVGVYPPSYLRGLKLSPAVTLTGPGAVLQGLVMQNCSGITFAGLELATPPSAASASSTFLIAAQPGCANLTFDHLKVHGAKPGDGHGISLSGSPGCSVTNCEIFNVGTGIQHLNSPNLTLRGNTVHDVTGDTIKGGGSSVVTIDGNTLGPVFTAPGDHPDYIQFFTTNQTAPTTDLTITNNVGARGVGGICQGVFLGDEADVGYQRVTITGNTMVGTMYRGISVSNGSNVLISGNRVAGFPDMPSGIYIDGAIAGVTLTNNIATSWSLPTDGKGFAASSNTTIPVPIDAGAAILAAKTGGTGQGTQTLPNPLQAQLDAANAKIADLTAQLSTWAASQKSDAAKVAALQAQLTATQTALVANQAILTNISKLAATA